MISPQTILKKYYGYSSFRPGQAEIVDAILQGRDALALMPTGGGKSICFQVPALMLPGCAIVISPLIALMNDQVLALRANGIPAAAIHSNQDEYINRDSYDKAIKGEMKIIYISPERMTADIDLIASKINVSLVAIDEAHCISQWGHDFRPVYTSLRYIKERFPGVPVMALTATADRLTRTDISTALGLDDPFCWTGSFDRPNISISVMNDPGKKQRLKIISSLIEKYHLDSGIVYCLSRKKTEEMHAALTELGYRSVCYHAGMTPQDREASQKAFVDGDVQVVCATIAFGMGIDKSNIRWVVHNNIPGNIESYYQEIGRAGRDGLPSEAIMFYNFADIMMRRNFVDESGQKEINSEKLDFMQKFAEASICRRRILLSYFSEEATHDCGNCDNCRNPRRRFDGTILAQKALSAVIRINAQEAMNTVIDILRGSNRADIVKKGYNRIKTYGVGADLSSRVWHSYMLQMIQLGLFEVAYEENFHLRPTPYGMRVVKGLERIELSLFQESDYYSSGKKRTQAEPKIVVKKTPEEQLTDILKTLRKEIAGKEGIPAYMVFSDASLEDMVRVRPTYMESFATVSGVGDVKLSRYGKTFVSEIRKFQGLPKSLPAGSSAKESLRMFNSGMKPANIASVRNVSISTVYSHLIQFADNDMLSDFRRLLTNEQYGIVCHVFKNDAEKAYQTLNNLYAIPSHIIRAALAEQRYRERHGNPG